MAVCIKYDDRIKKLATDITEARDRQIPNHLFVVQDILNSVKDDVKTSVCLRQQLWELDVLEVLHLIIKQDFSVAHDGWKTGARLAMILSQVCCGLNLPQVPEYHCLLLPESVDNLFILARRVQNRLCTEVEESIQKNLLKNFCAVMEALTMLFSNHLHLTTKVLESPWLLQLLITDDVDTVTTCLSLIRSIFRVQPGCLEEVSVDTRQNVMDELVYKVTVNSDPTIAQSAVKCILRLCECFSPLVEFMCDRYRGLRPLLKKWEDKGFRKQLQELIQLLNAGNAQRAGSMHLHAAAMSIQAWWRGVHTRLKLEQANTAFSKFQQTYRGSRDARIKKWGEEWQQVQLERQMRLKRQQLMRQFHEKQMNIIEILPAAQVLSYFEEEQCRAAVTIQSLWKGYRQRRGVHQRRRDVLHHRSAVTIQRSVRRWLERCEMRHRAVKRPLKPPGLTDARRVELRQQIEEHRLMYPTTAQTRDERETSHERCQEMLARYLTCSRATRSKHQHRLALLARIETDTQLLMYAPRTKDVTERDMDMYSSRSVPVAMKAKQNHTQELRLLRQPWWRKLGNEYQDRQYEEDEMSVLF